MTVIRMPLASYNLRENMKNRHVLEIMKKL